MEYVRRDIQDLSIFGGTDDQLLSKQFSTGRNQWATSLVNRKVLLLLRSHTQVGKVYERIQQILGDKENVEVEG